MAAHLDTIATELGQLGAGLDRSVSKVTEADQYVQRSIEAATRGGDRLTTWVEQAEQGSIAEIRSFANGLRKDWDAVKAGLTMAWSSGAVEGAVNRIKMLKRQMYGRANPDLLRRRILLAD